jgi:hypothetical protein
MSYLSAIQQQHDALDHLLGIYKQALKSCERLPIVDEATEPLSITSAILDVNKRITEAIHGIYGGLPFGNTHCLGYSKRILEDAKQRLLDSGYVAPDEWLVVELNNFDRLGKVTGEMYVARMRLRAELKMQPAGVANVSGDKHAGQVSGDGNGEIPAEYREAERADGEPMCNPFLKNRYALRPDELTRARNAGELTKRIRVGKAWCYLWCEIIALAERRNAETDLQS